MRCYICDHGLSSEEVSFNRDHDEWDPCFSCLMAIDEIFEPLTDEEILDALERELPEVFAPEEFNGYSITNNP